MNCVDSVIVVVVLNMLSFNFEVLDFFLLRNLRWNNNFLCMNWLWISLYLKIFMLFIIIFFRNIGVIILFNVIVYVKFVLLNVFRMFLRFLINYVICCDNVLIGRIYGN